MGLFDIVALLVIVVFIFIGTRRGFVFEVLCLALVLCALLIAYFLNPMLSDMLGKLITSYEYINRIVFVASFAIALVFIQIFTNKIFATFGMLGNMGKVMKILGGITAMFRGIIYAGLAIWLITAVAPESSVAYRINNGTITSKIKEAMTVSYAKADAIIRKQDINPLDLI